MVDIVTHGAIGLVLAAPLLADMPAAALAVAAGSIAPELDAFSRCFGKRAFLAAHQTWTHAVPVIAAVATAAAAIASAVGGPGLEVGLGLAVGMTLHSLLDLTNTYGITLWLPWSRRRHCREWLFFIDAGVIALTAAACAWIAVAITAGEVGWTPTLAWAAAMIAWIAGRAALRRRAARLAPSSTVALIPSAWSPLRFFGVRHVGGQAETFQLDAASGTLDDAVAVPLHDADVADLLRELPEVAAMRALSPAYHAVDVTREGDGWHVRFRDLRIRNFGTRFGECEVRIAADGRREVRFHA